MLISDIARSRSDKILLGLVYIALSLWLVALLFPLYYTFVSSFGDKLSIYERHVKVAPQLAKVAVIDVDLSEYLADKPELTLEQQRRLADESAALAVMGTLKRFSRIEAVDISVDMGSSGTERGRIYRCDVEIGHPEYIFTFSDEKLKERADQIMAQYGVGFYPATTGSRSSQDTSPPTAASGLPGDIKAYLKSRGLVGEVDVQMSWSILGMLDGYRKALTRLTGGEAQVVRWFLNSLVYSGGVILLQLPVSSLAAYALSRLFSKTVSRLLVLFYLIPMMLPPMMLFLPLFLMIKNFPVPNVPFTTVTFPGINLMNTYIGLILPHTAWGFAVILFKGFFDELPGELIDAARVDGASEFKIFRTVVMPLSTAIFAVVGIFTFMAVWMTFFWPYLVATDRDMWTLSVGLYHLSGGFGAGGRASDPRLPLSMAIISAFPTLFIFMFFQQYMVRGITWTGLKGITG